MNINATLFGQMLTFGVLIWFTMKFVWPPLISALDERAKKITDGLEAAQKGAAELVVAHQKAADIVRDARLQATEIIDVANKRANGIVDDAKGKAREEADRILVSGQAELERELGAARDRLRAEVVNLAIAGARQVLEHEVDSKAHAGMLEKLAAQL